MRAHRYFIMIVTVAIALNFSDMYLPFMPFEPISFFASRAMGVFIGIAVYVTLEWFVFGKQELIRWARANNNVFSEKLTDTANTLLSIKAQQPHAREPLLSDLSRAQACHAEAVADLLTGLDDAVFDRAQRLQRVGNRLQMSAYRLVCSHTPRELDLATRTRRLYCLLDSDRQDYC